MRLSANGVGDAVTVEISICHTTCQNTNALLDNLLAMNRISRPRQTLIPELTTTLSLKRRSRKRIPTLSTQHLLTHQLFMTSTSLHSRRMTASTPPPPLLISLCHLKQQVTPNLIHLPLRPSNLMNPHRPRILTLPTQPQTKQHYANHKNSFSSGRRSFPKSLHSPNLT